MIANRGDDDPGLVGERLLERGFELELAYRNDATPISLDGVDLLVLLGSDWSVYWERLENHVANEAATVRAAAHSDVPVLGICYGGQLMSHALGGSVQRADVTEIGWFDITSDAPELAPPGLWFEYHVDSFTPPVGAEVLATSSAGVQAYRLGRMLALQFHPEVTPEIVRRWADDSEQVAIEHGIDFDAVNAQSEQLASSNRERAHGLVDAFLDQVAFPAS